MVPEADTRPPLWVSWALVMAAEVIAIALIVRWSGAGERWDDRHRLALIVGQLSFFLLFGYLTDLEEGFAARSLTSTVAIYLFWRLGRRINSEATPAEAVPAASG
jgi:hypothetical protein